MTRHNYLVPSLDTLIGDPSILIPKAENKKKAEILYIPIGYMHRIDDFYNEQTSRGDACREIMAYLSIILDRKRQNTGPIMLENGMQIDFIPFENCEFDQGFDPNSSKAQAIASAKYLQTKYSRDSVAIMTGSDRLAVLASLSEIDVAHINPTVYHGRRLVEMPLECSNLWFSNHRITKQEWIECFPNELPLLAHEFVEFTFEPHGQTNGNGGFGHIGRYNPTEQALIPLQYTSFKKPAYNKIRPRNAGQAMLLEALLAPPEEIPIVIVSGIFGTGKTFLTTAAGYIQTEDETYDRVFVCPRDGALGKEIGFVPGDTTEKTRVKARPIEDNLREVLKLKGDKCSNNNSNGGGPKAYFKNKVEDILTAHFEFEPIINMGGRSLSDCFIIYDEFQDTERYQARALLSRIGDNSKIVVLGDPTQITNPHLNRTSNGLSYSASKLAGKPEAAIITLEEREIVRSPAAQAIAKYFG